MKSLIRLLKNIWKGSDLTSCFVCDKSARHIYESLTLDIPKWWSEEFEGNADEVGSRFTVSFGSTYKSFCVTELVPNKKVVWLVQSAMLDFPGLSNKSEWVGTKVIWNISDEGEVRRLVLRHKGLNPKLDCYEICAEGWKNFAESLGEFLNCGKGLPYKKPKVAPEIRPPIAEKMNAKEKIVQHKESTLAIETELQTALTVTARAPTQSQKANKQI